MENTVQYNRKPTEAEIKFGEGAIHWLDVKEKDARKPNGSFRVWLKNPYNKTDPCRYYY